MITCVFVCSFLQLPAIVTYSPRYYKLVLLHALMAACIHIFFNYETFAVYIIIPLIVV